MNKEQLIKKINDIVANEKFKLDAYFLCGFPTDKPNDELKAACEKYLETLEDKESNKAAAEAMIAEFEKELGRQAQPFAVTYAFELKLDGWGKENQPLHFFMVKANCNSFVDGVIYDSVTMAIDYDTGAVYDRYSVDESWLEKSEKEQAIYIAAEGGCFPDNYYSGEPIFMDSETHISLSDSDIAEINQALRK